MPTTIGTAYVQILPSTEGISQNLTEALNGPAESAGESAGSRIAGGLQTAAKVGAAAIGAAATGAAAITKSAVEEYANYEQLVGGVETLFKEASGSVMENAANAFQTAGMSANEYMETVTSFSASLLQSVGGDTETAAQYANMAITDMADNANKMGSSIESIQNAYQGFAKQNYTMLDNLKLGYGGTKTEMERLVEDAEKLDSSFKAQRDANGDLALSYADIVDAIHIVQTDMGITGTTAEEASSTIQGSLSSMKAAWSNMLVGISDDSQDFEPLVNNLVESVGAFAENIIPRVQTALSGIGQLVANLAPVIIEQLPGLIGAILPGLIESAMSLLSALAGALPGLIGVVLETIPELFGMILTTISEQLPTILEMGGQLVTELATGIGGSLPELIPQCVEIILTICQGLIQNLPEIVAAALELIIGLGTGLIQAIPTLITYIPEIVDSIADAILESIDVIIDAGWELIQGLGQGILDGFADIWGSVKEAASGLVDGVKGFFGIRSPSTLFRDEIGKQLMAGLADGISGNAGLVEDAMGNVNAGLTVDEGFDTPMKAQRVVPGQEDFLAGMESRITGALTQAMAMQNTGRREIVLNMNGREVARASFDDLRAVSNERGIRLVPA